MIDAVSPSVVQVEAMLPDPASGSQMRVVGSAVVRSADGSLLTNSHVVTGATSITIRLVDGTTAPAVLVGHDEAMDIAVIRAEGTSLRPAMFGNSDAVRVGDVVLAIGSPFGLGQTVTSGIISAKARIIGDQNEPFLQTDASINPGNSGGALVDTAGSVIGINTSMLGRAQNIGFAVPSNLAMQVALRIIANPDPPGPPRPGFLPPDRKPLALEREAVAHPGRRRGGRVRPGGVRRPEA